MIAGNKIKLRDKKLSDAHNDYLWQTDPELANLDAVPVLSGSFSRYLLDYVAELHYPSPARFCFAIETFDGKHIGNCVYYNVDEAEGETELGIMIGNRDYWRRGYGTDAVTILVNYIFLNTNLKRIYLKTLNWNRPAQKCFEKCGFKRCGQLANDGYDFILMEIQRQQWEKARELEKTNERRIRETR